MVASRRSWIVAGCVVAGLVVLVLLGEHLLNADTYRGQIEASLSRALGRPVIFGRLSFSLFTGSLVADAPSIADDPRFSQQPFLTAKDIRLRVDVASFVFHREVHVQGLTIEEPKISLLRGENGTWNYASLGGGSGSSFGSTSPAPGGMSPAAGSAAPDPPQDGSGAAAMGSTTAAPDPPRNSTGALPGLTISSLAIRDGTLTIGTQPARGPAHVYTNLDATAQHFAMTRAFPFTVNGKLPDGGSVAISGTAGPIRHDASLTPVTAQIALKHADLVQAGFVRAEQGVSGIADLDAKVSSNGQTAQADGTLHLTNLKVAKNGRPSTQPVDVHFSIADDLVSLSGRIEHATVQVGGAAMNVTGTYQTRANVMSVALDAAGQNMPVDALTAFLPSLGVELPSGSTLRGGTMTTNLQISGPTNGLVISGPVRVAGTQLAGFDLGQRLSSIQALTGARTGGDTTIQVLDTNLHYGPEGTRMEDLSVVVSGLGSATGSGMISAGGALNYKLVVKLNPGSVAGMAAEALGTLPGVFGAALGRTATNGIPLDITGTTANPVFRPDVEKMFSGTAPPGKAANPLGTVLGGLLGH
jgi:AsmA protein